ncbi:hypothetical protein ABL78_6551 [Leptomonas seymouri]|uniref:Zinc finger protein n=1 Tax=Leptomonas seymouri TaxID=5684 RepID=A0A0N1HV78_LEPSE|nr:hypothetical protein ABL78_6551 [Leptomonas seymouri]|eukprot:KPI84390.1 hypothetical protein ABL78_6551 [Leptomonas seymouri]
MATAPLPRQFTMVPGQDVDALFLCPICNDSWADPVELVPCGDIFCRVCIHAARAKHAAQPMIMENFQCPLCHTVVQSEKKPNRMLLNTVLEVVVKCCYCEWRGTREASSQHECEEGKIQTELGTAAAPLSPLPFKPLPLGTAELELSSSTAPSPPKALPPRRASGSLQHPAEPTSAPPGPRGPRRAVQEIEGAFTTIEDDPTSTTFRPRTASQLIVAGGGGEDEDGIVRAVSADYVLDNMRSSAEDSALAAGLRGVGGHRGQASSSPLHPALAASSPPDSSPAEVAARRPPGGSSTSIPTPASHSTEPWRRYGLSQVEYDQLVGIFMMYDEGTGRLNLQQLRDLCFCVNFVQSEEDVIVIFGAMNSSHKGYVTQDEFLSWMSKHPADPSALFGLTQFEYTDAILQFRSVDPEFNGVIDANDFCTLCLTNGYARTLDEAMRLFHICDECNTGYVSLQTYLRHIKAIKRGSVAGEGSDGGHLHPSGGDKSNNSLSPERRDYLSSDPANAQAQQVSQGYRQPYNGQQPGMFELYPQVETAARQQTNPGSPYPQRLMTSLNPSPGDAQQQQKAIQQQQQPYSRMGRSTALANAPASMSQQGAARQNEMQQLQSRLHRPSARPRRDEECSMM